MSELGIGAATDVLAPRENPEKAVPHVHEFITEDPYRVQEDVRLSQAENHFETLAHIRIQMDRYLQDKELGYRLTADLEFNAIPAVYLEGTGYRQKVAFDIGLWPSPPIPKRILRQNLGSISWPEWGAPHLVLEVLSHQTERVDRQEKRQICRRMGVQEFWLFDPREETQSLEGWRLDAAGLYQSIEANQAGELHSSVLGTQLRCHDCQLEWWDSDLRDWYSVERQRYTEGRIEGRTEGWIEGRIESLMGVARFYLDAERLDTCLEALKGRSQEDMPRMETLMQAITSSPAPADAVEAVLLGTQDAPSKPLETS